MRFKWNRSLESVDRLLFVVIDLTAQEDDAHKKKLNWIHKEGRQH